MWRSSRCLHIVSPYRAQVRYDVCVLGAGPAGMAAALRAVDYGKRVCLIEKGRIGGVDLWDGALQSKTMWEMAKFTSHVRGYTGRRCLRVQDIKIDEDLIRQSMYQASRKKEEMMLGQLNFSNVKLMHGKATFLDQDTVQVSNDEGEVVCDISADYFIVATGSKPRQHPTYDIDGKYIMSSDTLMHYNMPKSIVIVGAGVIGCEFASIYANFGATQVNIIEKADRILPMEDEDISLTVQQLLEKKKVLIHHNSNLHSMSVVDAPGNPDDKHISYSVKNHDGEVSTFEVERCLMSIGRNPNFDGLGLENIDCKVQNGRIDVDCYNRVKPHKHIYSCGDNLGKIALVNVGELEARSAIDHIYSSKPERVPTMDNLSTIMFLDQEVAAVGLNEQQCQKKNISYTMAKYGYEFVSRALAMNQTRGFVKIIVTNDREKRVLGVRAIGPHASSIVELASLAIHNRESAYDMAELMSAYPAVTQGFQECLRMLLGRSILKPNVFPQLIVKSWEPPNFERGRALQHRPAGAKSGTPAPKAPTRS